MTATCAEENCEKTVKQSYWNNIDSQNKGWFFQKNGLAWCPDHTPEWVEAWRKKRKGTW